MAVSCSALVEITTTTTQKHTDETAEATHTRKNSKIARLSSLLSRTSQAYSEFAPSLDVGERDREHSLPHPSYPGACVCEIDLRNCISSCIDPSPSLARCRRRVAQRLSACRQCSSSSFSNTRFLSIIPVISPLQPLLYTKYSVYSIIISTSQCVVVLVMIF